MTPTNEAGHGLPDLPLHMDTAPRDGTMVRLLVQFEDHATEDTEGPAWTIGACNDDNVGDDERVGWQFAGWCWSHDHFTEGRGTPVGWLPMIAPAAAGAQGEGKLTPDWLRAEAKRKGWYTREGTSVPTPDGDWIHPFEVTLPCRDLLEIYNARPQPAAADGGVRERDDGASVSKRARIIAMLVEVARAAHYAMDDCGDLLLTQEGANDLSNALDSLDDLPELDDAYVRDGWCKAKDHLAALEQAVTQQTALSSHRQAGEPDDVEKSVSVLRVLHQGSADDMAKAGREDLANVHYDAIRLLDYALDLHRQNVSMPNSENSEYKPWAKAIDELAWVIGELEYIEGMNAIKSSEIPDYISRKAAWRESCEALVKEHGRALLTPPPGADLSEFRELAERWRISASVCGETEYSDGARDAFSECATAVLALVEKGAGNGT